MIFAFEPKLVFPGEGALGVKDDYVVTENGVECLIKFEDSIVNVT